MKAAETRHLVPVISELWSSVAPLDNDHDIAVAGVLQNLVIYYQCLECEEYVLPDAVRDSLQASVSDFMLHYRYLRHEAPTLGRKTWHEVGTLYDINKP